MIYTITLNPSIDYVLQTGSITLGKTNRSLSEEYYIGGKGINVSCILTELGINSTVLGFIAGFTGDEIEQKLKEKGICSDLIRLKKGTSRINIKLRSDSETEINAQGPDIDPDELEILYEKISAVSDDDTLIIAGNIPKTLPVDTYEMILKKLANKKVRTVVDASGELLLKCLPYRPFLIKPNKQELSELFDTDADNYTVIEKLARRLIHMGAQNVLVSLGAEGAFLFADDGSTYQTGVIKEKVLSTVGAGDSMVAGFIAGFEKTHDHRYALRLGTACANATAFSQSLASKEKIYEIFGKL